MPDVPDWADPVWHLFVIASNDRDALRDRLADRGVGTLTHYFPLPHLTSAFRADGWRDGSLPVAERLAATSFNLPLYPQLNDEARQHVVRAVLDALG